MAKPDTWIIIRKDGERPCSRRLLDVIQLDHTNAEMRTAMADAMKYWLTEFDIDGFGLMQPTLCLWISGELRKEVDKVKKVTWLSEGSDPGLHGSF